MATTLLLTELYLSNYAVADEDQQGEIPPGLIERMKVVMKESAPDCEFIVNEQGSLE